jgi:hypothetical protein
MHVPRSREFEDTETVFGPEDFIAGLRASGWIRHWCSAIALCWATPFVVLAVGYYVLAAVIALPLAVLGWTRLSTANCWQKSTPASSRRGARHSSVWRKASATRSRDQASSNS